MDEASITSRLPSGLHSYDQTSTIQFLQTMELFSPPQPSIISRFLARSSHAFGRRIFNWHLSMSSIEPPTRWRYALGILSIDSHTMSSRYILPLGALVPGIRISISTSAPAVHRRLANNQLELRRCWNQQFVLSRILLSSQRRRPCAIAA